MSWSQTFCSIYQISICSRVSSVFNDFIVLLRSLSTSFIILDLGHFDICFSLALPAKETFLIICLQEFIPWNVLELSIALLFEYPILVLQVRCVCLETFVWIAQTHNLFDFFPTYRIFFCQVGKQSGVFLLSVVLMLFSHS